MRHQKRRTFGRLERYLNYGHIQLKPVEGSPDLWHLPGGATELTSKLIRRANGRGLTVTLVDTSREGVTMTRLN